MAQPTGSQPAGNKHQTGEATRPLVTVNLQLLQSQMETNSQLIQQFVADNGGTLNYGDNVNTEVAYLESRAVPMLRDLHYELQSQLSRIVTFADATAVDSERYNRIRAEASNALTTAKIYLESVYLESAMLLPSRPDPDLGDTIRSSYRQQPRHASGRQTSP